MNDFKLVIRSWEGAEEYLKLNRVDWAVSIMNPKLWGPPKLPSRTLHLAFHDVLYSPNKHIRAPRETHIRTLLEFTDRINKGTVLFHCQAGISRSTAAALIMMAQKMGPGFEPEAMDAVYRVRKCASPNRTMVELADRLLGRQGALLQAMDEHISDKGGDEEIQKLWVP